MLERRWRCVGIQNIIVEFRVEVDAGGTVRNVCPNGSLPAEPRARAVYEAARRALLDPRCNPLPLPRERLAALRGTGSGSTRVTSGCARMVPADDPGRSIHAPALEPAGPPAKVPPRSGAIRIPFATRSCRMSRQDPREDRAMTSLLSRRAALLGGLAFGLPVLGGLPAFAQGGPTSVVDITKARTDPIPIAIPDFAGASPEAQRVGRDIARVMLANLRNSGLFRPVDRAAFIQTAEAAAQTPRFQDWRVIGAQALTTGRAEVPATGCGWNSGCGTCCPKRRSRAPPSPRRPPTGGGSRISSQT